MHRIAIVACALSGCASYQPGAFTARGLAFDGQRATAGCLDVSVTSRKDARASAVLHYQFGNRCTRPVVVDLRAVAVVGRTVDGEEITLAPEDLDGEIRPLELDARLAGQEALAYQAGTPLSQVCVDLASIGRVTPAAWHCWAVDPVAPTPETPPPSDDPVETIAATETI